MIKPLELHDWRAAVVSLSKEVPVAAARLAAALLAAAAVPSVAYAAQCAERPGALEYLGRAPDNQSSYWISATNPGSYRLSAPGVPEIDTWSAPSNTVRISVSPVAKNDANGIHYLDRLKADGSFDCLLHTRNQTNPLLPPTWRPPARPVLPVAIRPEVPDRPIAIRPQLPERPVAVRPELPDRPVAVRPEPPVPPTVVRPEQPDLPQVIRPEMPDRPTVIRPQLPEPPVAVRPELPDRPVAVKPEPPEPPPVGRPDRPAVIELEGRRYEVNYGRILQYCPAARFDPTGTLDPASLNDCTELFQALRQAPLTPGRDLVEDSAWNAWSDISHLRSDDQRGMAKVRERTGTLSLGVDRKLGDGLVAGLMMSIVDQHSDSLWGQASSDARGWVLGPYAAIQLSRAWSLFGSALIGRTKRDQNVLTLSGESTVSQYSLALNAQGDYPVRENTVLRPKIGISYVRDDTQDYLLKGPVLGVPANVLVSGRNADTGQIQASVELNTTLTAVNGALTVAYVEAGAINNYLRDQSSLDPRWQGLLRGGFRLLHGTTVQIDGSAGYQSLGVSELSVWDARLFASYAF